MYKRQCTTSCLVTFSLRHRRRGLLKLPIIIFLATVTAGESTPVMLLVNATFQLVMLDVSAQYPENDDSIL